MSIKHQTWNKDALEIILILSFYFIFIWNYWFIGHWNVRLTIECYEHRDGTISKINGNIDEKVNSTEITTEYIDENGIQSISMATKVKLNILIELAQLGCIMQTIYVSVQHIKYIRRRLHVTYTHKHTHTHLKVKCRTITRTIFFPLNFSPSLPLYFSYVVFFL